MENRHSGFMCENPRRYLEQIDGEYFIVEENSGIRMFHNIEDIRGEILDAYNQRNVAKLNAALQKYKNMLGYHE